jgi:hypothetical protein
MPEQTQVKITPPKQVYFIVLTPDPGDPSRNEVIGCYDNPIIANEIADGDPACTVFPALFNLHEDRIAGGFTPYRCWLGHQDKTFTITKKSFVDCILHARQTDGDTVFLFENDGFSVWIWAKSEKGAMAGAYNVREAIRNLNYAIEKDAVLPFGKTRCIAFDRDLRPLKDVLKEMDKKEKA